MNYKDQLKTPQWKAKRKEILERDGHKCAYCEDTANTLHVHHLIYKRDCMAWEYHNSELVTLCKDCHKLWHDIRSNIDSLLAIDIDHLSVISGILRNLNGMSLSNLCVIGEMIPIVNKFTKGGGYHG